MTDCEQLDGVIVVTNDEPENRMLNLFLPTTPNPTSGYMLLLPREQVAILPLTVEEGIKLVIGRHSGRRAVAHRLEELGISNDSHVIFYDDRGGIYGTRPWVLMRMLGLANA